MSTREAAVFVPLEAPYDDIELLCETPVEFELRAKAVSKEPETIQFIRGIRPGASFWDVGASVGPYTLVAAASGLRVTAFEPLPASFAKLVTNLARNEAGDVVPLSYALGNRNGLERWSPSDFASGSAEHTWGCGYPIPAWRADTLAGMLGLTEPTFWKIDTDGREVEVLEGAQQLLAATEGLLIEVSRETSEKVETLLLGHGFTLRSRHPRRKPHIQNQIWMRP